ncbi:MAG: hypothetical protein Q4C47_06050, partial [Planctomycetia bacterium]|nr:hypothetical protein [Planctomycetia bacterium]
MSEQINVKIHQINNLVNLKNGQKFLHEILSDVLPMGSGKIEDFRPQKTFDCDAVIATMWAVCPVGRVFPSVRGR